MYSYEHKPRKEAVQSTLEIRLILFYGKKFCLIGDAFHQQKCLMNSVPKKPLTPLLHMSARSVKQRNFLKRNKKTEPEEQARFFHVVEIKGLEPMTSRM